MHRVYKVLLVTAGIKQKRFRLFCFHILSLHESLFYLCRKRFYMKKQYKKHFGISAYSIEISYGKKEKNKNRYESYSGTKSE